MQKFAILYPVKILEAKALELAHRLHLEIIEQPQENYEGFLILEEDGLSLKLQSTPKLNAIKVDFLKGANAHRSQFGGGKSQLIAKAIGLKSKPYPTILDATAGLGRDAFVLAALGCTITLLERSPIIATLLKDGIERAQAAEDPAALKMQFIHDDAIEYLAKSGVLKPDVIYLDPMFPDEEKSALVKKEMRILRATVGDDQDSAQLLKLALEAAGKRVVVKRARYAPVIEGQAPDYQLKGKSTRFDVYLSKMIKPLIR